MPGERRMRWWVPLVAVGLLVVIANGVAALAQQRARASQVEPSLTVIRPPGEVSALLLDGATLYAGGVEGLWRIDTASLEVTRPAFAGAGALGHVRALASFDGALWVGDDRGLLRVTGDRSESIGAARGVIGVRALAPDGDVLWIGTVRGLFRYQAGSLTKLTKADGLADDMVNAIAPQGAALWIGSYVAPRGGVTRLRSGDPATVLTKTEGLPHADVTCITPMPDGTVWVGTGFNDRGGLAIARVAGGVATITSTMTQADGLPGAKVRSITRLADGTLLIGSEYDGVLLRAGGTDRVLTTADGLSDNEAKVAVQGPDGRVWLGTRDGVTLMQDVAALVRR